MTQKSGFNFVPRTVLYLATTLSSQGGVMNPEESVANSRFTADNWFVKGLMRSILQSS